MAEEPTTDARIEHLRELIASARSMPMSASCVINRSEVLRAIDDLAANLPDEIAGAREVIEHSDAKVAEGEAEAQRIISDANEHALEQAGHSAQVKIAEEEAKRIVADAESEADELRREVDVFIDSRMASFESVLVKTTGQVQTARKRLADRNTGEPEPERRPRVTELPSLD